MPISYNAKLIFVHIPKCAGTTIEQILNISSTEDLFNIYPIDCLPLVVNRKKFKTEEEYLFCIKKRPQHLTYRELNCILPRKILESYTFFTTIRNPYSKFVSGYHFSIRPGGRLPVNTTFFEYADWLNANKLKRTQFFDGHFETQTSYLINENNLIEEKIKIFKYDNLNECFEFLKDYISFKEIPHLRKSHIDKPYQEYYTEELQNKIYNFYKEDFINFNYPYSL